MKAVGYTQPGDADVLTDIRVETPVPGPRDLLVSIKAVSVNPVDAKLRANAAPDDGAVKILGHDAAGVVEAIGDAVTLFKVGDEVFYSGAIDRPGANAEYHLVDERIAGRKPSSLSFGEAAALPLTALTAWELLFDRLRAKNRSGALLIINGAGGVGSILIQLARRLTDLTIIATASRPETRAWVAKMGAHHSVDHHAPIDKAVRALGIDHVDYVAGLTGTDIHLAEIAEIIAPQGHLSLIDDVSLDIGILKPKSISVTWEMVFTRSLFGTDDMIEQHHILNELSSLIDAGVLQHTLTEEAGPINAENLRAVHRKIEQGKTIGKIVLSGFD